MKNLIDLKKQKINEKLWPIKIEENLKTKL
jgi:hypothetical protein